MKKIIILIFSFLFLIQETNCMENDQNNFRTRPFICLECDYATIRKSDLDKHIRIHVGERLFKCPICDFGALSREILDIHVRRHMKDIEYVNKKNHQLLIRNIIQRSADPVAIRLLQPGRVNFNLPAPNNLGEASTSNTQDAPRNTANQVETSTLTLLDKNIELEADCNICNAKLNQQEINLTCGHNQMHLYCLMRWLTKGNTNCPICRRKIINNIK